MTATEHLHDLLHDLLSTLRRQRRRRLPAETELGVQNWVFLQRR